MSNVGCIGMGWGVGEMPAHHTMVYLRARGSITDLSFTVMCTLVQFRVSCIGWVIVLPSFLSSFFFTNAHCQS